MTRLRQRPDLPPTVPTFGWRRYGSAVPACLNVYVWVRTDNRPSVLAPFIDRYVDADRPGEPRFPAFLRTFVAIEPDVGDLDALSDLRRDDAARSAFSLYLHARTHHEAIITVTEEGDLVLGLGLDEASSELATRDLAATLMLELIEEFGATGGVAGIELPPPQSAVEWLDDGLVMLRVGSV